MTRRPQEPTARRALQLFVDGKHGARFVRSLVRSFRPFHCRSRLLALVTTNVSAAAAAVVARHRSLCAPVAAPSPLPNQWHNSRRAIDYGQASTSSSTTKYKGGSHETKWLTDDVRTRHDVDQKTTKPRQRRGEEHKDKLCKFEDGFAASGEGRPTDHP